MRGVRAQLTMPVDPNLGLWQQPQVHHAGLQCSLAVAGSFLAAQLLNHLIGRAVNKVRCMNTLYDALSRLEIHSPSPSC